MQINAPYGFQEIVPLARTHRVALSAGKGVPAVFQTMNPIPVSFVEFPLASRDYPLVFISGDGGKSFLPMAVLGLAAGQNLYVQKNRTWDARAYVPAYVRRYPFCMTRVTVAGKEQPERVVCVEKGAIADDGDALFDAEGKPTPAWEARQKLLFEYEADLARTEEMCRTLAKLELLEPFAMQAKPNEGEPLALTGMYRVAETKLGGLAGDVLQDLVRRGILARVYAHLMSLDNFRRLLDRRAAAPKRSGGNGSAG